MVAWFKHDIPAWMDGTEDLDAEPYRAYHVICQLIYLNEGPIALNEHGIAGRCKQSIRTFRTALKTLLELGKLTLCEGRLGNSRAGKELEKVSENRVNASEGGKKSGESRNSATKSLETNNAVEATLQGGRSLKTREEETREEKKEEHCPPAKAVRTAVTYSEDFESNFWKPFPRTAIMSKKEAWREWMKLEPDQRSAACLAIPAYDAHLKKNPTLHAVHACRFLSQNRAEGILEIAAEKPKFDVRAHLA